MAKPSSHNRVNPTAEAVSISTLGTSIQSAAAAAADGIVAVSEMYVVYTLIHQNHKFFSSNTVVAVTGNTLLLPVGFRQYMQFTT